MIRTFIVIIGALIVAVLANQLAFKLEQTADEYGWTKGAS